MFYKEETIDCPLCGASKDRQKTFFKRGKNGYYIEENEKLFNNIHVFCDECGLIFINPRMTEESLEEFYKTRYRNIYGTLEDVEIIHAKSREQFLIEKGFLIGNKKLLDIGSSTGAFPFLIKNLGVDIKSLEPNQKHIKFAKEVYSIEHIQTVIEKFDTEEQFDIITIFDTFEHLLNPGKFLNKATGLLKGNGFIYMELPTIYLPRSSVSGVFSAAHPFCYSETTLAYMLEKFGFRIDYLDHGGHWRDMRVIARKINTNRTEFYKKDSFNTITAIWKMFETIKFQIFPKIIKANRKEEVMDLVEETAEKYNYFRGFIYRFAAAIIIRFSMEDAFRMIQKGWHYFSNEDEDISEGNIYTLLAIQKFNQKEYHSAYDFFMKGVSLLSRIHEINNLPEQIDIDRIKRRLAQEGHSSFALYKLGKELSSIFGQTEKTREYQKIMDFYKIE